ncbi:MAG: TetR/AcrR family transcriptional regulator [Acidimicrobiales bacterium]
MLAAPTAPTPTTTATAAAATGAARSRQAMIAAAERLFAERGIAAVSLREIGAAAGQRNNSAAQYHFGSKAGLVEAIFAFRMATINERRLAALAELDATDRSHDVRGLVEAYVRPLAESFGDSTGERWYLRFLARVAVDPHLTGQGPANRVYTAGLDEVLRRLDQSLVDVPGAIRGERLVAMGTLLVNTLATLEAAGHDPAVAALLTADLVDMATALLTAPVSPATRRLLDTDAPG